MKTKMIFNIKQADLFIQHGCRVSSVGLGRKSKVFVCFIVDETFETMLEKWNNNAFVK